MKKKHISSLKFHTMYSIILALVFITIIIFVREIALVAAMVFLFLYVAGNGIIHSKKNELSRDTLLEYSIVAIIVLVLIFGVLYRS